MARPASVLRQPIDRIGDSVEQFESEVRKLQRTLDGRRRKLEKRLDSRRRAWERRARRLQQQLSAHPLTRRALRSERRLRTDLRQRVTRTIDALRPATRSDINRELERMDRQVARLSRRLSQLEGQRRPQRRAPAKKRTSRTSRQTRSRAR